MLLRVRRCLLTATSREYTRRKSAHNNSYETVAMLKLHLKRRELKLSRIVRVPYVLMLLLLATAKGGLSFPERVSLLERGRTPTFALASKRKRLPGIEVVIYLTSRRRH